MKPIASVYIHFLDRYHGQRASQGNHHSLVTIRNEANLAFRLALMFSQRVILPCSSIYESQLCRLTIDAYPEFRAYGVIGLSSPDGSIEEHLVRKQLTYDAGSPADLTKSYERLRAREVPAFYKKYGSTTRQLTRAWRESAEIIDLEEFLREGAPPLALAQLERLWPQIPELLESRAFVPDHVNEIFAKWQVPVRPSAAAEIIEPAYIGDYARQFGSVVSDLSALRSPFEYGVSDEPKLFYRNLAQRLRRFHLDTGFECAPSAALWDVYCSGEWDALAERLFRNTATSEDADLARAVAARLTLASTLSGALGKVGRLRAGDLWSSPPVAANDPTSIVQNPPAPPRKEGTDSMLERQPTALLAAVICAVEREYKALIRAIPPNGPVTGNEYVTTLPNGRRVLVRRLQSMGNYQSAAVATQLILKERPENLILTGIAGGFPSDDRRLGDLLIADQVIAYEYAKLKGSTVEQRPQAYRSSYHLVEAAEAVFRDGAWRSRINEQPPEPRPAGPQRHVGSTLSGEKVVAKSEFLEDFRTAWTPITGIEMEAAGAMTAVYLSELQPRFVMIKAICDHADEGKADGWQPYAAAVAAAFVAEMLTSVATAKLPSRLPTETPAKLTNEERYHIRARMHASWEAVASFFDVPPREQQRFRAGYQSEDLWEWLKTRRKLHELPVALMHVGRRDIVDQFPRLADQLQAEQNGSEAQ